MIKSHLFGTLYTVRDCSQLVFGSVHGYREKQYGRPRFCVWHREHIRLANRADVVKIRFAQLFSMAPLQYTVPFFTVSRQIPAMEPKMKCEPSLIRLHTLYVNLARYLALPNLAPDK